MTAGSGPWYPGPSQLAEIPSYLSLSIRRLLRTRNPVISVPVSGTEKKTHRLQTTYQHDVFIRRERLRLLGDRSVGAQSSYSPGLERPAPQRSQTVGRSSSLSGREVL